MTLSIDSFSQTYTEAREKFHAAATAAGLVVQSHRHPLPGRDGEALALDVARLGADDATAVLVLSSGCHGVEGFCGSGVQVALLRNEPFRAAAARAGVAVLFLHALNPWGFSWWRRTTHENVDLNRNWHDFDAALPDNPGYDELADAIVPAAWPPTAADEARLDAYAAAHGLRALQAAITGGQYRHPDGLFYGGQAPTWSQGAVRAALRQHATRCSRLGWIDLHTGLGPSGHGERIFAYRNEAAALERARAWWGADITSIYDGSSSSAQLQGLMWGVVDQECAQARYTGIALEYGTLPLMEVLHALRADQWLANHPGAPAALAAAIKQRTRDAFYTDTPAWKAQVLVQAHEAVLQAVAGLS